MPQENVLLFKYQVLVYDDIIRMMYDIRYDTIYDIRYDYATNVVLKQTTFVYIIVLVPAVHRE